MSRQLTWSLLLNIMLIFLVAYNFKLLNDKDESALRDGAERNRVLVARGVLAPGDAGAPVRTVVDGVGERVRAPRVPGASRRGAGREDTGTGRAQVLAMELWEAASEQDTAEGLDAARRSGVSAADSVRYALARGTYIVPAIERTTLVDCAAVLANDTAALATAARMLVTRPKVPVYEEVYVEWLRDCPAFRRMRGYVQIPLTKEEETFPLAFSIAMYKDVEQTERLLRAIYQPQNIYCIHVDTKTSLLIHRTVRALAACFENVFIATRLDKIKWGDVSVLLPAINCMRYLVKYHRHKWKYFINLTGQEFPLRTNYELVRIAKIFNGSNDIGGSYKRMEMDRVKYHWTHRWSKTYQQTIFYNTNVPKDGPPHNLTFFKGELHGLFAHRMVEYIVESGVSRDYLQWCWDSGHPSEHYWNVLNYNRHLRAPGGYEGSLDVADRYSYEPVIRAKHWLAQNYAGRACHGKVVRGICVYGVGDMPWLAKRRELFANKFHLTYEYLAYDCLEERHRNRTARGRATPFDEAYYRGLPTVKYSRKNGL